MPLFKRKRFAVQTNTRLVRENAPADSNETEETTLIDDIFLTPEVIGEYAEIAKDLITHSAVVVTAAYSICRIVKALTK